MITYPNSMQSHKKKADYSSKKSSNLSKESSSHGSEHKKNGRWEGWIRPYSYFDAWNIPGTWDRDKAFAHCSPFILLYPPSYEECSLQNYWVFFGDFYFFFVALVSLLLVCSRTFFCVFFSPMTNMTLTYTFIIFVFIKDYDKSYTELVPSNAQHVPAYCVSVMSVLVVTTYICIIVMSPSTLFIVPTYPCYF